MKAISQALNFGKSVSDNGWGMFVSFLKYKLEEQGKKTCKGGQILCKQSNLFLLWICKQGNKESNALIAKDAKKRKLSEIIKDYQKDNKIKESMTHFELIEELLLKGAKEKGEDVISNF